MDFPNIAKAIEANAGRAVQLATQGGISVSNRAFKRLSWLMSARAMELGITGITYNDNYRADVEQGQAFSDSGREAWAVVLQAQAMLELAGVDARSALFVAPQEPIGHEFEVGARPMLDTGPGVTTASLSLCALDAATQHALLLGIASKGYTLEEWDRLPEDADRDISLDAFLVDLELSWASLLEMKDDMLVSADLGELLKNWPELMTVESDAAVFERIANKHSQADTSKMQQGFTHALKQDTAAPAEAPAAKPASPAMG